MMPFSDCHLRCHLVTVAPHAVQQSIWYVLRSFSVSFGTASVDIMHSFTIDQTRLIVPSSVRCSCSRTDHSPSRWTCRYTWHPPSAWCTDLQLLGALASFPQCMLSVVLHVCSLSVVWVYTSSSLLVDSSPRTFVDSASDDWQDTILEKSPLALHCR